MLNNQSLIEEKVFKTIILYMFPIFAAELVTQGYGVIESMLLSRFSDTQTMGAIGSLANLFYLSNVPVIGLNIAMSIVIAICFGKNSENRYSAIAASITLCMIVGTVMMIILESTIDVQLRLLNTPMENYLPSKEYLSIYYASTPIIYLYLTNNVIFRATGDSLTPFILAAVSSVMNIILDILLIGFSD